MTALRQSQSVGNDADGVADSVPCARQMRTDLVASTSQCIIGTGARSNKECMDEHMEYIDAIPTKGTYLMQQQMTQIRKPTSKQPCSRMFQLPIRCVLHISNVGDMLPHRTSLNE